MTQTADEDRNSAASQADIDTWRILKKALRTALSDRGFTIGAKEVCLITRFTFEYLEACGLRITPLKPTRMMQQAIKQALDQGKRMSLNWVKQRTKQRWRYQAALEAAPSWRRGFEHERNEADRRRFDIEEAAQVDDASGRLAWEPSYTIENKDVTKLRDLNFKVDPDFHREFKRTAAASGKSMKALLEECYDLWSRMQSITNNDRG